MSKYRIEVKGNFPPAGNGRIGGVGDGKAPEAQVDAEIRQHQSHWDAISPAAYERACEGFRPVLEAIDAVGFRYCRGAILEIGCGSGRFLQRLAERGEHNVVGIDVSMSMLRAAAGKGLPRLLSAAGERLPFGPSRFDTVVASWSVFKYLDRSRAHAEVHRVLRPNGYLVFDLSNYWPSIIDRIWEDRVRQRTHSLGQIFSDYKLRLNMRSARAEVQYLEAAGLRLVEMRSVKYLPLLRGRPQRLGYWPGYWGSRIGYDTIFVCQKGDTPQARPRPR